jgi:hypothetical protein
MHGPSFKYAEDEKYVQTFWRGNMKERTKSEDQVINGTLVLTLTLQTWTKWWAPASARKWQMGFNSAFKGLNVV